MSLRLRRSQRGASQTALFVLIVIVVALAATQVWLWQTVRTLRATTADQGLTIAALSQSQHLSAEQLRALRQHANQVELRLSTTSNQLTSTRQQLSRKLEQTQQQTQTALTAAQQQTSAQLGTLSGKLTGVQGDVQGVKGDVASTRTELAATEAKLAKAIGDLGVESGLIARTRGDLDALERRGDRAYFEFNLTKTKQPVRLGPVAVQLRKADVKHGRYTLWLYVNDQRIEKKDRTLDEPVQFYLGQQRALHELVVYQIAKNRVIGYLSAPKFNAGDPGRPKLTVPTPSTQ